MNNRMSWKQPKDGTVIAEASTNKFSDQSATGLPKPFLDLIEITRANPNRRVLRAADTAKKSGQGVSTMWRDIKAGTFAPPIRLSETGRSVGWIEAEVDAILAAKILITRTHLTIDMQTFVALLCAAPIAIKR